MRLHANTLTLIDIREAARIARADLCFTIHGSRSRNLAFEVKLTGFSNRRPNFYNGDGSYAATWDQWGVFLSVLFDRDPSLYAPSAYVDRDDFDRRTSYRFDRDDPGGYWPTDAHGDHRFKFVGVPRQQSCSVCSAVQTW